MELVLDLHLHSRFSRAVSQRMNLPNMYIWGRKKGINVFSIADFTHPVWFRETQAMLEEAGEGMYRLKNTTPMDNELGPLGNKPSIGPYFMLSTEVAAIYSENGAVHKIHNLIFAPSFEVAAKINKELLRRGFNLSSDGRPILGISSRNLMELLMEIDRKIALIPCHIWTPWFSLYGSRSGYDRIADCFGDYAKYIFAVETGLSSDPMMNWRIKELDSRSIVSFSDAHSLEKMGREATVLRPKTGLRPKESDITYSNILNAFVRGKERIFEIAYTIEFYPEEGKYHFTGHRNCGVSYSPDEDRTKGTICPVCKRELTVGVMHRVEELANTPDTFTYRPDENGVVWVHDPKGIRPQSVSLVPLLEILSEALSSGVSTQKVLTVFDQLVRALGSEHEVLFRAPLEKVKEVAGGRVAEGIQKVRSRNIKIRPGFDGEYGHVSIWSEDESSDSGDTGLSVKKSDQIGLF